MRVELILRVIGVALRLASPGPSNSARPCCTASVTCVRAKANHLPGPEVITAGTGRQPWFAGESRRGPSNWPTRVVRLGAERCPVLICSKPLSAAMGAMIRTRGQCGSVSPSAADGDSSWPVYCRELLPGGCAERSKHSLCRSPRESLRYELPLCM